MQTKTLLFLSLGSIKGIIHLIGNQNYGFHRDELLHLACGEHLAWGYMEFPPFIAWMAGLSHFLFDASLGGTRIFATVAGLGILWLVLAIAEELGAQWRGLLIAGVCVLAFLPFFRNHTLFQPVAFDQFFWTLAFYCLLRYLRTDQWSSLIGLAIAVGLGLLNKYTMGFWILGTGLGLLFYQKGAIYQRRTIYGAGLLGLLIWAPNIGWQWSNDWPVLGHLSELQASHLSEQTYWGFVRDQLILPATLVTSLVGLWWLSRKAEYRWIAISVGIIFLLMLFLRAKTYYVYPIYPVLFAAGGVSFERWLVRYRPVWTYLLAASIVLPFLYFIPHLTPVLPIDQYIVYLGQEAEEVELTSDYADMFGWPEQVALVDSIYQSLSAEEQANCTIWAENYGEAGAIHLLGKEYGLPAPVSRHGSFWTWGYGNPDPLVWISVGNELPVLESVFQNIDIVRYIDHPYAVAEERGIPVAVCRGLKVNLPSWWASYEDFIFN